MIGAAFATLNSQPIPGWANKSKIKNESSQAEDINPAANNSENKSSKDNPFKNAVTDSSSAAEGQNKNKEENEAAKNKELSSQEKQEIRKLQQRDRQVRAHEMAHQSAGGQYAGSASYSYQTGPDNKRYAVGGSVDIETSPAKTPEETVKKADQIKRAATAPAQPSTADLQVAAKAARMKMEAQGKLNQKNLNAENNDETTKKENYNSRKDDSNLNSVNKYLRTKRENSYQLSQKEVEKKKGIAA